jgi:hypothetical protein
MTFPTTHTPVPSHHITSHDPFYSVLNLMMNLSDLLIHRIVQQNYSAYDMLWGQRVCLWLFLLNVTKKGRGYCLDIGQWQVTLSRSGQWVVWLTEQCLQVCRRSVFQTKARKRRGRKGKQIGTAAPGATFRAQVDVCCCYKWANKMLGSNFDY